MEILLGAILVALVMYDVFHSIVVPRISPMQLRIAPFLGRRILWPLYFRLANIKQLSQWRDDLLAFFAPLYFAYLMVTWLLIMIFGYALILYGLRADLRPPLTSFSDACYFAGTAVLTLGFGDIVAFGWKTRFIVLLAALTGLSLLALGISYLFTLQNLIQQREQVVNTVISRAGTPASGLIVLLRYKELGIIRNLGATFLTWETWVASILESHRAYPILLYFRSTNKTESWFSVLGAMLDASSLLLTSVTDESIGESELFYWLACSTVQALCRYLNLEISDHVRLTKSEFINGLELLKAAGFELREESIAWKLFQVRRKAYIGYLYALAQRYSSPVQAWIYDLDASSSSDQLKAGIFQTPV